MNKDIVYQRTEDSTLSIKKNKSNKSILLALLLIALLGTWGYIIWDKNKTKELISQKDNSITATAAQRDELQKEFVHYPADLNELPLLIETHLTEIYAKRDYEGYVKYDLKNPGEITFDEWNFWKDVSG